EDRDLEYLLRCRPIEALADVVDIGHNKDREDRRLGNNDAEHGDAALVGLHPRLFRLRYCYCAHRVRASLIFPIRIIRMFHVPQWPAAGDYWISCEVINRGR